MTDLAPTGDELARVRRALTPSSGQDVAARQAEIDRLLEDRGVTYGAPAVPEDAGLPVLVDEGVSGPVAAAVLHDVRRVQTPWRLDPQPLLLDEDHWTLLEAGVTQRAELLDAVLADLYGERRLLSLGLIPPELVLGHPGFLRSTDGIRLPGERQLFLAATDLVRDDAGEWAVIADRTQAPSGAGYAMEGRRILSQVLSEVYRGAAVRRLGPFFHALRQAVQEVAPATAAAPRAVLLSPGAASETAFDQTYLSSMLGIPVVEGDDLQVGDGRLWMRGLNGLEPVDVLLRRVDADFCDPVDLRSDSRLGVPGLVEAARAGTVSVVNTLGSSVLESPALSAYLPQVCRALRGEDLRLPAPSTYWCGDPAMRTLVLARLPELVLTPLTTFRGPATVLGWTLGAAELAELRARIEAEPAAWAGQEPVHARDATEPPTLLRTFAVAHRGAYHVMAGGLALTAPRRDVPLVSSSQGAVARDVWVLSRRPHSTPDPWLSDDPAPRPLPSGISARTAQSLYWLGRYTERADAHVRILRALADRWTDFHDHPDSPGGQALAALERLLPPGARDDLLAAFADPGRAGGVAHAVTRLSEAAAQVRDQMPRDTWLILSSLDRTLARARALRPAPGRGSAAGHGPNAAHGPDAADEGGRPVPASPGIHGLPPLLDRALEALLALAGLSAESLVRDTGWQFLEAGRRIERAQGVVAALRATLVEPRSEEVDSLVLESVLISQESAITYRRRNPARATVATVLDLLLGDAANPRALVHALRGLQSALTELPPPATPADRREHLLDGVAGLLAELDVEALAAVLPETGRRERLAETLESLHWRLRAAHDELTAQYLTRVQPNLSLDASSLGGAR